MSKPQVKLFIVAAPGVAPDAAQALASEVEVEKVGLHWKFADFTQEDLIDLSKQVDQQLAALEKWNEMARNVLKQKLPKPADAGTETVTRGRFFEAHYVKSVRTDIDREKVKVHLGDRYPEFCKTSDIYTLKIVPVSQTPGVAG